jgi:3-phosphoshikimate 1-carboxyvinyltransferase
MRAGEDCEDVNVRSSRLQATTIEADEVPGLVDEVPILALAAAMADGVSPSAVLMNCDIKKAIAWLGSPNY